MSVGCVTERHTINLVTTVSLQKEFFCTHGNWCTMKTSFFCVKHEGQNLTLRNNRTMNVLYAAQSLQAAKFDSASMLKKTLPELRPNFACLGKAGHEYLFRTSSTFIPCFLFKTTFSQCEQVCPQLLLTLLYLDFNLFFLCRQFTRRWWMLARMAQRLLQWQR